MSELSRIKDKANKAYQQRLKGANDLLYSLVADMQSKGKSIREIAKSLAIKRADVLKILHKDVGSLTYDVILRIQSFYECNLKENK